MVAATTGAATTGVVATSPAPRAKPPQVVPDRPSGARPPARPDRRHRGRVRRECSRSGDRRISGSSPYRQPRRLRPRVLSRPHRLLRLHPLAPSRLRRVKLTHKPGRGEARSPHEVGPPPLEGLWWRRRRRRPAKAVPGSPMPPPLSMVPPALHPPRPCGPNCKLHWRKRRRGGGEAHSLLRVRFSRGAPVPLSFSRRCVVGSKHALRCQGHIGR